MRCQVVVGEGALQLMQRMIRVGNNDKLHGVELLRQIAGDAQARDGQVGAAVVQTLFYAGEDFFAQLYTTAAALRHEGVQRAGQAVGRVGGVYHQAYFCLPALVHLAGQHLQLAGLGDQMPGAAQQRSAGFGQYRLAAFYFQQRDAQLFLHAGNGVTDRRL